MTYGEVADTLLMYPVIDGYVRIDVGLVSDVAKMVKDLEKDCSRYLNHISMLQEKIKNGNEWISVEERLPEPLTSVLAYDYKNKRVGLFCFKNPENMVSFYSHWMPLPEPPKPKELTFKDVFLKAFPKATILNPAVTIDCCAVFPWLLDEKGCCQMDMTCSECWNQPYFDEEGEADA